MNRPYIFTILLLIGCHETDTYKKNNAARDTILLNYDIDTCQYNLNASEFSPVEFLQKLKIGQSCPNKNLICSRQTSNWVKKEDIPQLIPFLNSNEPAYPVFNAISSFTLENHGTSTIGREAYFIVNSYRTGLYPPLSTIGFSTEITSHSLSDSMRIELMEWWDNEFKKDGKQKSH